MVVTACGATDDGDGATGELTDKASGYRGIAFSGTDPQYTSGRVDYADFSAGGIVALSTGESGDPALFWQADRLWLFNRSATRVNYRTVDPRVDGAAFGKENATEGAGTGDPHDVLALANDRVLLAHTAAGSLTVLATADGALKQTVAADFAVGEGDAAQLRPQALMAAPGDPSRLFLLHQGLDAAYAYNGSQQIFVLKDDGTTVTAVDQDPDTAGVQGVKLAASNPLGFFKLSTGALVVAGMCYPGQSDCVQGFEVFDPETLTVKPLVKPADPALYGNGGVVAGPDGTLHLQAVRGTAKLVVRIDPATGESTDLHTYPEASNGARALAFDDTSGALYIGDDSADGAGILTILRPDQPPATVATAAAPYTITFVPK